jgi:hypothetical protein
MLGMRAYSSAEKLSKIFDFVRKHALFMEKSGNAGKSWNISLFMYIYIYTLADVEIKHDQA